MTEFFYSRKHFFPPWQMLQRRRLPRKCLSLHRRRHKVSIILVGECSEFWRVGAIQLIDGVDTSLLLSSTDSEVRRCLLRSVSLTRRRLQSVENGVPLVVPLF